MTVTTQVIQPRLRPQVFLDHIHSYAAIEAMLAEHNSLKYIMRDLVHTIRKIRRKASIGRLAGPRS
jgi:hemerythrin-like domain-containing protein